VCGSTLLSAHFFVRLHTLFADQHAAVKALHRSAHHAEANYAYELRGGRDYEALYRVAVLQSAGVRRRVREEGRQRIVEEAQSLVSLDHFTPVHILD